MTGVAVGFDTDGVAQPGLSSANSPPSNDNCRDATFIGVGTEAFSTQGARTDGPIVPPPCDADGDNQVGSDIWFCHPADCTDTVVVSLCGSDFDTKLAVYEGCGCPAGTLVTCNDDGCRPDLGVPSRVTFAAERGQEYLIRVGGFSGLQGSGLLTIYCQSDPTRGIAACGQGAGDCFSPNDTPACDDVSCCEDVCALDHYCCDVTWDNQCSTNTDGVCTGFAVCDAAKGGCLASHPQPGCSDSACCNAVCEIDELCCLDAWDEVCVTLADACIPPTGACCDADGNCTVTVQSECVGQYLGDGTVCGGVEACCLPDGTCKDIDAQCCRNQGGSPQGPGSACQPIRACCLPPDDLGLIFCENLEPQCCIERGGRPGPEGSTCTASEACCLPDGTCASMSRVCCFQELGDPQGQGTICDILGDACCDPETGFCTMMDSRCCAKRGWSPDSGDCFTPTACCLPDNTCMQIAPNCCDQRDGTVQGPAGTACEASQACCFDDGSCQELEPKCCRKKGGGPQGVDTQCGPEWACCYDDDGDGVKESCGVMNEICCNDRNGTFHAGADCGVNGACCYDADETPDGIKESCKFMPRICCEDLSGEFFAGTECGPDSACCYDANGDTVRESCVVLNETCCADLPGGFFHSGEVCGTTGACCIDADGDGIKESCEVMAEICCEDLNGDFAPNAVACGPEGACCFDKDLDGVEEACLDMAEVCCAALYGHFQGAGTSCSPPQKCCVTNPDQADTDGDGVGDACDTGPAPPLEAADDGLGGDYNRVGDFKMPTSAVAGGQEVAIRVTLDRMYIDSDEDASQCPPRQGLPDLQVFEGRVRYLGPPEAYSNNDASADKWVGAKLQCTPFVGDWSASALATLLGGGVNTDTIYYYGAEVVPCSIHDVQQATQSCVDSANEDCFSDPLEIRTALWGDVWPPFGGINFTDIGKIVEAFKGIAFVEGDPPGGAPNKWRSMLRENEGAPASAINFTDIGKTVDAFKTIAYAEDGPTDCP